jgi:hypothetical protein
MSPNATREDGEEDGPEVLHVEYFRRAIILVRIENIYVKNDLGNNEMYNANLYFGSGFKLNFTGDDRYLLRVGYCEPPIEIRIVNDALQLV